jgi:hypothetical protein
MNRSFTLVLMVFISICSVHAASPLDTLPNKQAFIQAKKEADQKKQQEQQIMAAAANEDRAALKEGKKQIYGTQVCENPATKTYFVCPLADPLQVDARRASKGMPSMSLFLKNYNLAWDPTAYSRNVAQYEELEKMKKHKADKTAQAEEADKAALKEGRKQLYGTQICNNPNTRKFFVCPLDDPNNVDKRRSELGLAPIATYLKNYDIIWNAEEYKTELVLFENSKKSKQQ